MATKKQQELNEQDPEVVIETAINTTEEFIFKNGKTLLVTLAAIIIVVGGFFAYKYLYQAPRAKAAADMMYVAEQLFSESDYQIALNGDESKAGFLDVINQYGGTKTGNLAKHYAGICYLYLGDLDNALECLKSYKATSGIPNQIIEAQNIGLQGDIYSQKQNYQKAADLYIKAASSSDNSFTAPSYLYKAVAVYVAMGQNQKAMEIADRIIDEYADSLEARDVLKVIGQIEK